MLKPPPVDKYSVDSYYFIEITITPFHSSLLSFGIFIHRECYFVFGSSDFKGYLKHKEAEIIATLPSCRAINTAVLRKVVKKKKVLN